MIKQGKAKQNNTFYSNLKAEIIINDSNNDHVCESIYTTIISNIQKTFRKRSSWIIDSVIDYIISISKYNPLAGNSYIELPKELNHPGYLHPADNNPKRIAKADKDFAKNLNFENIKFPVKVREKKKIFISIKVFGYEYKKKHPIYVPKNKVLMYEFYYDYIKNKCDNKSKPLFTKTHV